MSFSLMVDCPGCGAGVYPIDLGIGKVCRYCWEKQIVNLVKEEFLGHGLLTPSDG